MSDPYPFELHPPRDEQDFEDFCRDLFQARWGDSVKLHGRRGQGQKGVDIYARVEGEWVGVQCKKKGLGKDLAPAEIDKDVKKALSFESPLSKLIFATTAPPDEKAQAKEREINDRHAGQDPRGFVVEIKFWAELEEMLREQSRTYKRWCRRLSRGTEPEIYAGRLPSAQNPLLIGRKKEIRRPDEAWADPTKNAISLVAVGGEGKTALVDHWLQRLAKDDWRWRSWGRRWRVDPMAFPDPSRFTGSLSSLLCYDNNCPIPSLGGAHVPHIPAHRLRRRPLSTGMAAGSSCPPVPGAF